MRFWAAAAAAPIKVVTTRTETAIRKKLFTAHLLIEKAVLEFQNTIFGTHCDYQ